MTIAGCSDCSIVVSGFPSLNQPPPSLPFPFLISTEGTIELKGVVFKEFSCSSSSSLILFGGDCKGKIENCGFRDLSLGSLQDLVQITHPECSLYMKDTTICDLILTSGSILRVSFSFFVLNLKYTSFNSFSISINSNMNLTLLRYKNWDVNPLFFIFNAFKFFLTLFSFVVGLYFLSLSFFFHFFIFR
jgi:hypothetical protein